MTQTHTLKHCPQCAALTLVQSDGLCECGDAYAADALTDTITLDTRALWRAETITLAHLVGTLSESEAQS